VEYSVVVLPEPVGPVTSTMPCGRVTNSRQVASSVSAELAEFLDHDVRVEDAHDDLLAERGRHARQTQLDFATALRARLDAAVLRAALLGDVHAAEDLDARGHRGHHRRRQLEHLVHDAVDAEAHVAHVAARFEVDVRRALLERVLQQPVDDVHDMAIVDADVARLRARRSRS
jgi:hypothetical protein